MAANPKHMHSTAGRFCPACGAAIGEGKRVDECDACRSYIRRAAKRSPLWVMKRRHQVNLWDRRMALILPGDLDQIEKEKRSDLKLQPLSIPRPLSVLKKPSKPSLRLVRSGRK